MRLRHALAWLTLAASPVSSGTALAQSRTAPRAARASSVTALVDRCTAGPDASACRAVLRASATRAQRSVALTYLDEAERAFDDSLLRAAIALDPSNALAHVRLADRRAESGLASDVDHLRTAVALRPDWTHLHRRIARAQPLQDTAQRLAAIALWRRAAQADPRDVASQIGLGRVLLLLDSLPAAEAAFRRADAAEPGSPVAAMGLCETLLKQRRSADLQAPCTVAIRDGDGTYDSGIRHVLFIAEEAGELAIALAAAERGLQVEPRSSHYRSDRTRVLYAMGREADAVRLLRADVAAHPGDWDAVEELANIAFVDGDLREARDLYRRIVHPTCGDPNRVCTAHGYLAIASLRLGLVDEAFASLVKAFDHQTDCPDAYDHFRRLASMSRDSAALLARLARTVDEFGSTVVERKGNDDAADFFATVGDWERAERHYRIAVDSADARERQGQLGRFASGLRWLHGRALVEVGRYCEGLRVLRAARTQSELFENGRPFLRDALSRATAHCREDAR